MPVKINPAVEGTPEIPAVPAVLPVPCTITLTVEPVLLPYLRILLNGVTEPEGGTWDLWEGVVAAESNLCVEHSPLYVETCARLSKHFARATE